MTELMLTQPAAVFGQDPTALAEMERTLSQLERERPIWNVLARRDAGPRDDPAIIAVGYVLMRMSPQAKTWLEAAGYLSLGLGWNATALIAYRYRVMRAAEVDQSLEAWKELVASTRLAQLQERTRARLSQEVTHD